MGLMSLQPLILIIINSIYTYSHLLIILFNNISKSSHIISKYLQDYHFQYYLNSKIHYTVIIIILIKTHRICPIKY